MPTQKVTRVRSKQLHRKCPVVLSMVYPGILYGEDGTIDAKPFTHGDRRLDKCVQASLPQMQRGGVNMAVLSYGINDLDIFAGAAGIELMLRVLDAVTEGVDCKRRCVIVRTRAEMDAAMRRGQFAVMLHVTGTPLNGSLAALRTYWQLGVRVMHPFGQDEAVGGHAESDLAAPLTNWGRQIIREMQRLSMLIDLTHANDPTFKAVMRMVDGPVIDSHTCCRKLVDIPRNRTDAQLRAIAATGGVVGVHFGSAFIDGQVTQASEHRTRLVADLHRRVAAMKRKYKNPYAFMAHRYDPFEWSVALAGVVEDGVQIHRASLDRLVDHIDHMVNVMGIDHVGIGTDYALGSTCQDVETADKLPNLTHAILERGYRADDVAKILGGNFLRVFRKTLPI